MPEQLVFALTAVFVAVATVTGTWHLDGTFQDVTERRRMRHLVAVAVWARWRRHHQPLGPTRRGCQESRHVRPQVAQGDGAAAAQAHPGRVSGRSCRRDLRARRDGAARHFRARDASGISG